MDISTLISAAGFTVSAIVVPVLLTMRRESREDRHEVRERLNTLSDQVGAIKTQVAVLNERDRIAEMLDNRLPPP